MNSRSVLFATMILMLSACGKTTTIPTTTSTSGAITAIAGNGQGAGVIYGGYSGDGGAALKAGLNEPTGIAVDANGNVYIADMVNNRVRKVNQSGIISTIAGNGTQGYSGDGGAAVAAQLADPSRVGVDAAGNVYIVDTYNGLIRKVNPSGMITTIAGNMTGYAGDGSAATGVAMHEPYGVAIDDGGNVYIADLGDNFVRKVTPSGSIINIAGYGSTGAGNSGYTGDGGPATNGRLSKPAGVAVDGNGNVYIADNGNNCIRMVTASGIISTMAGNGSSGYTGDGGPATAGELNGPRGIAVDGSGNVYIADNGNNCIRKVTASGIISTIAGTGVIGYGITGNAATATQLNGPYDVTVDAAGNVYIADTYNQRIVKINK